MRNVMKNKFVLNKNKWELPHSIQDKKDQFNEHCYKGDKPCMSKIEQNINKQSFKSQEFLIREQISF